MYRYVSDRRPRTGFNPAYPILIVILALAAFLRFWEIGGKFHFMGDEGTQSGAEVRLLEGHLPLLGPSLSIGTMHLGPLFYYLMAGPLAISGGSPAGPTVVVGIFGLAAVALMFFYLRSRLGDYPALGASAVMAASFLMVEYSRRPWNPTLTPFFALLFLLGLVRWKRGSPAWLILAAGSLAALLQLQPVNVFLVVLLVVFIFLARPPPPRAPVAVLSILVFAVISLPLIIYDATHRLANTRAWLAVFLHGKSSAPPRSASSLRLLFNLFNRAFEPRIIVIAIVITVVISLAAIYVAFVDHEGDDTNWEVLLPLILLIIAAIGFEVYRKQVFEQYMVCLFIIPFVFAGAFVRLLWKANLLRLLAVVVVLGLVAVGIRDTWTYSFVNPQITVADAAVTSHDLQPDDTYQHVLKVKRRLEVWARRHRIRFQFASYLTNDTAYLYVLRRDGYLCTPRVTGVAALYRAACRLSGLRGGLRRPFLVVEPLGWPRRQWPDRTSHMASIAYRSIRIGISWLYQVHR